MVRDLILDMAEHDLLFENKSNMSMLTFDSVWGNIFDEDESANVLLCNILIPQMYWGIVDFLNNELTIYFRANYFPSTLPFNIRLIAMSDAGYALFPNINGRFGITANSFAFNRNIATSISASMLPFVNIDGEYAVRIIQNNSNVLGNRAYIYSAKQSDIMIGFSDSQASQLLSLCAPGKYYRYPTTGVGITKYLNSVIEHTDLIDVFESQFESEHKSLRNAEFDSESGELEVLANPEREKSDENLESVENLSAGLFSLFTDDYVRRNQVLTQEDSSAYLSNLNEYSSILELIVFGEPASIATRTADRVTPGRFNGSGNIIPDSEHFIVSSTLEANTILLVNDEGADKLEDSPLFIIDDNDETRLYTSLVGQPYWLSEQCYKCFILKRRATIKYVVKQDAFREGKGLYIVSQASNNIKNMLCIAQDEHTGELLGIVSNNTNISDIILDEVTQHIYAIQNI